MLFFGREKKGHTAAHEVTRPNISIPASASAVLAATEPAATLASTPSDSIITRKMSMVDLGRSSRRTEDSNAWCMATPIVRSSASCAPH